MIAGESLRPGARHLESSRRGSQVTLIDRSPVLLCLQWITQACWRPCRSRYRCSASHSRGYCCGSPAPDTSTPFPWLSSPYDVSGLGRYLKEISLSARARTSEIGPSRSLPTSKRLNRSIIPASSDETFTFLRARETSWRRILSTESPPGLIGTLALYGRGSRSYRGDGCRYVPSSLLEPFMPSILSG
jgi:hypothetical protein